MVKQVLEFARGVECERIVLQLKHLIKEITRTMSETLPKSIEVECFVPDNVWPVTGDPTQIHEVLMKPHRERSGCDAPGRHSVGKG
jgi:two-component system cell cycle sensor histidine kinase/response regulator CckA